MASKIHYALIVHEKNTILATCSDFSVKIHPNIIKVIRFMSSNAIETGLFESMKIQSIGFNNGQCMFICVTDYEYPSIIALKFIQDMIQHVTKVEGIEQQVKENGLQWNQQLKDKILHRIIELNSLSKQEILVESNKIPYIPHVMTKNLNILIEDSQLHHEFMAQEYSKKDEEEQNKVCVDSINLDKGNSSNCEQFIPKKGVFMNNSKCFWLKILIILAVIIATWLIFSIVCGFDFICLK